VKNPLIQLKECGYGDIVLYNNQQFIVSYVPASSGFTSLVNTDTGDALVIPNKVQVHLIEKLNPALGVAPCYLKPLENKRRFNSKMSILEMPFS